MRRMMGAGLLATTVALGVAPTPADACGNAVERRVDHRVIFVARAERSVEAGDFPATVKSLAAATPKLRTAHLSPRGGVVNRAMRVMAKVVARTDGAVPDGIAGFPHATDDDRAGNVKWAHRLLTNLALNEPDDPTIQTELAEITAHQNPREAMKKLTSLEERDLLTSAWGYRALMKLRRARATKRSSFLSVIAETAEAPVLAVEGARCLKMAEDDAICDLEGKNDPRI